MRASPLVLVAVSTLTLLAAKPALAACGNGVLDPGEACDDGNTASGDGCSATCTIESGLAARPWRR